jgi:hypothetical protein
VTVATLRVRLPSGALHLFLADRVEHRDGRIHAVGRWRWPSGRHDRVGVYSWPQARVLQIRPRGGGVMSGLNPHARRVEQLAEQEERRVLQRLAGSATA